MAPLIRHGDTVVIKHGRNNIYIGDIVVYKGAEKICAHRFITTREKSGETRFVLKGDNRIFFDPHIAREQIIGKIVEAKGKNGDLRFDAAFWMGINYILAKFSYVSGMCHAADSRYWEITDRIIRIISKIVLNGNSFWDVLLRIIAKTSRMMCAVKKMLVKFKGRENGVNQ